MMDTGMPYEHITEATGLTQNEIESLRTTV